jgi:hypothetical protein
LHSRVQRPYADGRLSGTRITVSDAAGVGAKGGYVAASAAPSVAARRPAPLGAKPPSAGAVCRCGRPCREGCEQSQRLFLAQSVDVHLGCASAPRFAAARAPVARQHGHVEPSVNGSGGPLDETSPCGSPVPLFGNEGHKQLARRSAANELAEILGQLRRVVPDLRFNLPEVAGNDLHLSRSTVRLAVRASSSRISTTARSKPNSPRL